MAANIKESIGLRIRAARQRTGLTQEALAAQVSRTPESISNIERGLQLPAIDTLADLGRALGVPVAEFFEDEPPAHRRSRKRVEVETRLREIGRALTDRDLAVAVAQASVLLTERS